MSASLIQTVAAGVMLLWRRELEAESPVPFLPFAGLMLAVGRKEAQALRMSDDGATTKGTILRSLVKFVSRDLSPEQYAHALAALPSADRQVIEQSSILPSQKISEFTLNRLTVEAAKAKGESVESFGRRAGRVEMADAVGIYRFLTVVLTPTALLRKASTLWTAVHSHGTLIVEDESKGSARVTLTGLPSEEAHCARLSGWFERAGEMTGARNAKATHVVCMVRGGSDCQWQLTW